MFFVCVWIWLNLYIINYIDLLCRHLVRAFSLLIKNLLSTTHQELGLVSLFKECAFCVGRWEVLEEYYEVPKKKSTTSLSEVGTLIFRSGRRVVDELSHTSECFGAERQSLQDPSGGRNIVPGRSCKLAPFSFLARLVQPNKCFISLVKWYPLARVLSWDFNSWRGEGP